MSKKVTIKKVAKEASAITTMVRLERASRKLKVSGRLSQYCLPARKHALPFALGQASRRRLPSHFSLSRLGAGEQGEGGRLLRKVSMRP
jgi:hypothetical protein